MKATICDCCHKIIQDDQNGERMPHNLVIISKKEGESRTLDFCDNCRTALYQKAPTMVFGVSVKGPFPDYDFQSIYPEVK